MKDMIIHVHTYHHIILFASYFFTTLLFGLMKVDSIIEPAINGNEISAINEILVDLIIEPA